MPKALLHTLLFLLLCSGPAFAKRLAPAGVAPVTLGGLEYRAENTADCPGCLDVIDKKTGKRVNIICVYKITYNPLLERDVQWVFIKKLEVEEDRIIVTNEKGDAYLVNPHTLEVKKL
jgi:hypothetical protein